MLKRLLASAALAASLSACGTVADAVDPILPFDRTPPSARAEISDPAPYVRGTLRPYTIRGRTYTPVIDESYDEVGVASWYGDAFHGRPTATGETYDMNGLSAAHTTLPLPSLAEVTNLRTGQTARGRAPAFNAGRAGAPGRDPRSRTINRHGGLCLEAVNRHCAPRDARTVHHIRGR